MNRTDRSLVIKAIGSNADAETVEKILKTGYAKHVDQTDPESGVTPLMVCAFREDTDETLRVAQLLMRYGARIDTRDESGPGCTALIMAAQEGKPKLLDFLIQQGATIDITPNNSSTQAISFAAQNNRPSCIAKLAEAAKSKNKRSILEAPSKFGRTPAYVGVERAFPEVVGVLTKAGADLRRACPVYFTYHDSFVDPFPDFPDHFALNATVRSFVSGSCTQCGAGAATTMKCSRCRMAFFCGPECQKQNWSSHKRCCKGLRRGQDLFGDPKKGIPDPSSEPYGFQEDFTEVDHVDDAEDHDPETHPKWEYDDGGRGTPQWKRYPARIETSVENLLCMGSPRYMYRPGKPSADGKYEPEFSIRPPSGVATRYIYFCDMVERDIYTGASRAVRRNGKRQAPKRPGLF